MKQEITRQVGTDDICGICGTTYNSHSAIGENCPNKRSNKPMFLETSFTINKPIIMEKNLNLSAFPLSENGMAGYSKHEHTTITFVAAMLSNYFTKLDSEEDLEAVVHKAGELAKLVLNAF